LRDRVKIESEKPENKKEGECYLDSTNRSAIRNDDGEPLLRPWWQGFAIARWMLDASDEGQHSSKCLSLIVREREFETPVGDRRRRRRRTATTKERRASLGLHFALARAERKRNWRVRDFHGFRLFARNHG